MIKIVFSLLMKYVQNMIFFWERYVEHNEWKSIYESLNKRNSELDKKKLFIFAFAASKLSENDQLSDALENLKEIEKKTGLSEIEKAQILYLESIHSKYLCNYEKSIRLSQEACDIAYKEKAIGLWGNIKIHLGICYGQNGDLFLALHQMKQIATSSEIFSEDRKCAISNEFIFLADLGQIHTIEKGMSRISENIKDRFELYIDLVNGRLEKTREILKTGYPEKLTPSVKNKIVTMLIKAVHILGTKQDHEDLKNSWVMDFFNKKVKNPQNSIMIDLCLFLLGKRNDCPPKNDFINLSWRHFLTCNFLYLLAEIKMGNKDKAMNIITCNITPMCQKMRISNPLFPYWTGKNLIPCTEWSKALSMHLGVNGQEEYYEIIILKNDEIQYRNKDVIKTIPFKKSPQALKLLKALCGSSGISFYKNDIHITLFNKDMISLSDHSKLQKLLSRTKKRLVDAGIPAPWRTPGDKTIVLSIKIKSTFAGNLF